MPEQHPVEVLRNHYQQKIRQLHRIFSDTALCTLIAPENEDPLAAIETYLDEMDEYLHRSDISKYRRAFRRFITELNCFKLRIISKQRQQHIWNPLDEPFADFSARTPMLEYYYADTPHPPVEMIARWLDQ